MVDVCDFHSHILPMADHGSISVEQTVRQLTLARDHGVCRIFATPHFYPHRDTTEEFLRRRDASFLALSAISMQDKPKVKAAAEVLLCPGMEKLPGIEQLCVPGTKTILLELPFNDFSRSHVNSVSSLLMDGYTVVLAHAERYDVEWVETLVDLGAKLQLNASAITPIFREYHITRWIKRECVVAIGSDIHGNDKRAYRDFKVAVKRLGKYISTIKDFTDSVWSTSD